MKAVFAWPLRSVVGQNVRNAFGVVTGGISGLATRKEMLPNRLRSNRLAVNERGRRFSGRWVPAFAGAIALLADELRRGDAGEAAHAGRGHEARAGKIAPVGRPRKPARGAAAGKKVRKRFTVFAENPHFGVDLESALRMRERTRDLADTVRRLEHRLAREVATELVSFFAAHGGGDVSEGLRERLGIAADDARDLLDGTAALDGACLLGLDVARLLHGNGVSALVPDRPGGGAGLVLDLERLLRVARVLVGEALAVRVHVEAAFGDGGPVEMHAVRRRHRAVALEGAHVLQ